jgi:hypothetical protein
MSEQTLRDWTIVHSDARHPGSRNDCEHCQAMIAAFGPMPPAEDILAYERSERRRATTVYKQPIPKAIRWAVWERDNFTCQVCGARRDLSVDHIVPEIKGGTLDLGNLQTLCSACNSRKGTR